jgi:hypothetical protein
MAGGVGFGSEHGQEFFSSPQHPEKLLGPANTQIKLCTFLIFQTEQEKEQRNTP